jgi:ribonuclease HII
MQAFKLQWNFQRKVVEAGCDEAGRGCLAGPVVAAAVILPKKACIIGLDDSKKLNHEQRNSLRYEIEKKALAWNVAFVTPQMIDNINILQASFLAMHQAVEGLTLTPELLLIDGNRFKPYPDIAHECFVKGDGRFAAIAAASILAKTYRDDYMSLLAKSFPEYGWEKNAGYPTAFHRDAIARIGTTPHHRLTFRLLPQTETTILQQEEQ